MGKFCAVVFSLLAGSLCADNANPPSQSMKASLFGENENSEMPSSMHTTTNSNDASMPRVSLFGESAAPKKAPPMHPPFAVFLDHPPYVFEIEYAALILQPTASNLHYAAEADPLPAPSPNWKIHDIDTDYHFGFDLGVKGNIPSTNTNLVLDWEHFRSSDSSSTNVPTTHMIGPFFEIGPDASPYKKARGHVHFAFDQVNLDYGIFVHLGRRLRMNFFAGLGIACMKESLKSEFSDPSGSTQRTIKTPSKFTGAGPRFGTRFSYRIFKGLQFDGGVAADFFMGNQTNHTEYSATSPALALFGFASPNKQETDVSRRSLLVPGFEGNINLAYSMIYRNHFLFKIAAGYQTQIYLNAIQSVDIGSEVVTPPVLPDTVGVFARTFQRTLSNFALSGPFVKVTLGF